MSPVSLLPVGGDPLPIVRLLAPFAVSVPLPSVPVMINPACAVPTRRELTLEPAEVFVDASNTAVPPLPRYRFCVPSVKGLTLLGAGPPAPSPAFHAASRFAAPPVHDSPSTANRLSAVW